MLDGSNARRARLAACVALSAVVTGCANYRAVGEFGTETARMSDVVRTELVAVDALCVEQAELQTVVIGVPDDRVVDACTRNRLATGRFARVTLDVLDQYAEALDALANDRRFDVDAALKKDVAKVATLNERAGGGLSSSDIGALGRVVAVLGDIAATAQRDAAIRTMVAATPDLKRSGLVLKNYFVGGAGTTDGTAYGNLLTFVDRSARSTGAELGRRADREPIRVAELQRLLRSRQKDIDARTAAGGDAVPARIGAALDAWLVALDTFAADALRPDAADWITHLKQLRAATRAARTDRTE